MNTVTGRYNLNFANVANKKNSKNNNNLSFGATPQELKDLTMSMLSKPESKEAGKLLAYLVNSSKHHPFTQLFLESKPIKEVARVVKVISERREMHVSELIGCFKKSRAGLNDTAQKLDTVLAIPVSTPSEKQIKAQIQRTRQKVDYAKEDVVRQYMPGSYRGDYTTSVKLFDQVNPIVMAKHKASKRAHDFIEDLFYKPDPTKLARLLDKFTRFKNVFKGKSNA